MFYSQAYAPTVLLMQKYKIGSENKWHVPLGFELRENQVWSCWDQQCCAKHLFDKKIFKSEIKSFLPHQETCKKAPCPSWSKNGQSTIKWPTRLIVMALWFMQWILLSNKLKQVRRSGSILLPWRVALSIRLTIKLAHTGKITETWATSTNERTTKPYFTLHASLQGHHILRHVCNTNTSWPKFHLSRQSFVLFFHVYSDTNIPLMATRFFPRKQISSA